MDTAIIYVPIMDLVFKEWGLKRAILTMWVLVIIVGDIVEDRWSANLRINQSLQLRILEGPLESQKPDILTGFASQDFKDKSDFFLHHVISQPQNPSQPKGNTFLKKTQSWRVWYFSKDFLE